MTVGGFWKVADVDAALAAGEGGQLRWNWLAHGEMSTANIIHAEPGGPEGGFLHYHAEHDETLFIASGTGTFDLGGDERPIGPGTVIFIPRGTIHEPKLMSGGTMLSIYAPAFDPEHPDRYFVTTHDDPREA